MSLALISMPFSCSYWIAAQDEKKGIKHRIRSWHSVVGCHIRIHLVLREFYRSTKIELYTRCLPWRCRAVCVPNISERPGYLDCATWMDSNGWIRSYLFMPATAWMLQYKQISIQFVPVNNSEQLEKPTVSITFIHIFSIFQNELNELFNRGKT